nr:endonuclease domain-containing protein [Cognataquiflexum nitidum]
MFYGASPEIFRRARELRKNTTPSENNLWTLLRKKQFEGYKFRRQHPVFKFIADFYCHELRLSIELDGGIHLNPERAEYDLGRTFELHQLGIEVMRISNEELCADMDAVSFKILNKTSQIKPHPSGG